MSPIATERDRLIDLVQQLQAELVTKAEAAAMWQARAQLLEAQLALPAPKRAWWRFW